MFARLLAGEESVREDALGTLTRFVGYLQYRGNLPWAGTMLPNAPAGDVVVDAVVADFRLGFFHTLRLGDANFHVYAKLVASPCAMGLRHVDASRTQILSALIAGKRTRLRRLSGVKFASREVIEALADPTFDSVVEIETEVQAHVVDRLLDYIARDEAKFFARAQRHLVLNERLGRYESVAQAVLKAWERLPVAKLTLGGVTLSRDGTAVVEGSVPDAVLQHVATRFRVG